MYVIIYFFQIEMESVVVPAADNGRIKARPRSNSFRTSKSKSYLNHKNCQNANRSKKHYPKHINNINKSYGTGTSNSGSNNTEHDDKASEDAVCCGNFTREVYKAICLRLGPAVHIPEDSLQALFNDMQLYPSKTQVSEMLQCARQCSRRNGSKNFITFGEFCVFVKEMKKQSPKERRNNQTNRCTANCEVFLGGSCNPTTWRADTVIPELTRRGITYYNPQVSMWAPELVAQEYHAKQSAAILFFVADCQTRNTSGMIEVAYLVAAGRCVILVAYPYQPGQTIMGETVTPGEFADLVNAQSSLIMLVKSRGVKVHTQLSSAVQCTSDILKNTTCMGLTPEEQVTQKLRRLREVFDANGGRTGEISLTNLLKAYKQVTNSSLSVHQFYNYFNTSTSLGGALHTDMGISFDKFCALVAEFSVEGCNSYYTNGWAMKPLTRQYSCNNNSCNSETVVDNSTKDVAQYDIYLGGSLTSKMHWRRDVAIPLLKKHGLSYYNPAIREGYEIVDNMTIEGYDRENNTTECKMSERILEWKQFMDRSKVLLFVITNDTRSLTTMILAAYYIGLEKEVVLFMEELPMEDCSVVNETLSEQAVKDYNRGRVYLKDLAERKHYPVFENITEAVQHAINKCQNAR